MTIFCGRRMRRDSKPGNELSPFLDPANDARLQARSRGETASRPFPAFQGSHRWEKRGRSRRGRQAGAGEKGAWGLRHQLYLFCTNNCFRVAKLSLRACRGDWPQGESE
jgi:hypothetical protein